MIKKIINNQSGFSTQIKTGIDHIDKANGLSYGEMTVITGTAASGKTTQAIDIAINLGVKGDKKILYLTSKKSRFVTELLFLRRITEQDGNRICHELYQKHFPEKEIEIADKYFDISSIYTIMTVATALEDCNVTFISFDGADYEYIENELNSHDYDVVILDTAYDLHPSEEEKLSQQAFCTKLCSKKHSQAFVVTAPIPYKILKDESDITLEHLTASNCGKILANNASTIIGLRIYSMLKDNKEKYVILK